MKTVAVVFLVVSVIYLPSDAYKMTKCQLIRELKKHGFSDFKNWMCLVEHESSRQTHIIGKVNSNGSRDHGLFQINDKNWCSNTSKPGKECNATCAELRTDDITKAVACAKKIFQRHGYNAWFGWRSHCQGPLPDMVNIISKC